MKIAIIGVGNMGGAIARGLASGHKVNTTDVTLSNPSNAKLNKIKAEFPDINITNSNEEAVNGADAVIVAVKPWKVDEVLTPLHLRQPQILISVAAGLTFEDLSKFVDPQMTIFRVIPNTAISELSSLTLVAAHQASEAQINDILDMFNEMGLAILMEECQFEAGTALSSCGIAYVMKYVEAAMQAGVELGLRPKDSMKMLAQTLQGAAQILLNHEDTRPSIEIEKVTTPGGITIKGINQLEHDHFPSAVINAIKASK